MAAKSDRRTSNLFIAGGYCLVAIIILFNYLGQSDVKDRSRASVTPVTTTSVAPNTGSVDNFSRQLEEERRLNQEMRDIIRRLQSSPGAITSSAEAAEKPSPDSDYSIPDLNNALIKSALAEHANPFIPGKNPFAAPSPLRESANTNSPAEHFLSLRCDPRLPFVFNGANSRAEFYSNF
ncbi:MAG TPA: hypothetical protein PLM07_01450 [Candidatus Rifleibacterium sp.]|nr:hypothetical protein [Candidatus Rifleibacterium sp.]HPT44543.1 hypothetical protein [Candidatus Rifleibacterium sp.]